MKGTANTRILKRSIIKHIKKGKALGVGVGNDFSTLSSSGDGFVSVSAMGAGESGETALLNAANNLATCGAEPTEMLVGITAGEETPEQQIRDAMHSLTEEAGRYGIRIAGGNTFYSGQGADLQFTVTLLGQAPEEYVSGRRSPRAGDKIVISGFAGEYGAREIVKAKADDMTDRFAGSYLESVISSEMKPYIKDTAGAFLESGAVSVHDVSYGGIYRSLEEISERWNLGIRVIHERIPIRQSTIEICEYWNINPYMLLGTGSVVAVVPEDQIEEMEKLLQERNIPYSVAGELTKEGCREVVSQNSDMKRSLTYYEIDEIFKK